MSEGKPKRRRVLLALGAACAAASAARALAQADASLPIEQPGARDDTAFIERAMRLRRQARDSGDQAYGAVVVRGGHIVGEAPSRVVLRRDPTAHAEMEAIRDAASRLGSRDLGGCTLYSSSPPCPMCEAAAYWAGIERLVYGSPARDGGSPRLCG